MKTCSSIDTDDILFKVVSEAVASGAVKISGGIYPQGERPDDSTAEDIVINTITITQDKPQSGTSNINIWVADEKVTINKRQQYKSKRERLRELGNAIVDYLKAQNLADLEFWIEGDTTLQEAAVNQHYRNLRIGWCIH